MRVTFLGSGDAFGHGGRLQACILLEAGGRAYLLDCGASALISLQRYGVEPNRVEGILVSHLHGDHFGGVPFFVLDAQLFSKRRQPLMLAGPPGLARHLPLAMEAAFPGSSGVQRKFAVQVQELPPGRPQTWGALRVTPFAATHPPGEVRLMLRLELGGRVLAYTGDTGWEDGLIPAAQGADLLIAEAYFYERAVREHLSYRELRDRLGELGAKRTVVTHMAPDMLARLGQIDLEAASDGLRLEL
ncbi:MAG: MBL fold metallo-hydrolase [Desulfarculus sp.]|nr:MAG: MBL fold metallo-hydrolase [Desulfarculus sp.]